MSPNTLSINPLPPSPQVVAQVAAWHHQECMRQGLRSSLELRHQRLQLHLQGKPLPFTLVAECQGQLVGCVSLVNYHLRQNRTDVALSPVWLSNLFVCEDWRCQGIGAALVEAAVTYVGGLGKSEVWLSAAESTDFYLKRGWQITRRTRLGGRLVNIMRRDVLLGDG